MLSLVQFLGGSCRLGLSSYSLLEDSNLHSATMVAALEQGNLDAPMKRLTTTWIFVAVAAGGCMFDEAEWTPVDRTAVDAISEQVIRSSGAQAGVASEAAGAGPEVFAPSMCSWAASNDVVVVGTLRSITFVDTPMVQGDWRWVEGACDTANANSFAMEIELDEMSLMYVGSTSLMEPEDGFPAPSTAEPFTARVGYLHRWKMRPTPVPIDSDGEGLSWMGYPEVPAEVAENTPWRLGERIGVAARYVPAFDGYSLMGEAVLRFDEGAAFFEPHLGMVELGPPEDAPGLNEAELESGLSGCEPSDESQPRFELFRRLWGPGDDEEPEQSPAVYYAAYCSEPDAFDVGSPPGEDG